MDELRSYVHTLTHDIHDGDRAYELLRAIGENADAINAKNLGKMFGHVQDVLTDHFCLAITKLFERPSDQYSIRSVSTTLNLLETKAATIPIALSPWTYDAVARIGIERSDLEGKSDEDVTRLLISVYRQVLPTTKNTAGALVGALKAWRTRRNKDVAHNEAVPPESFPTTTWSDSRALLNFAKQFVGTLGTAYLSMGFEGKVGDKFEYLLTTDAEMDGMAMRRLLTMAGIASPPPWLSSDAEKGGA